MVTLQTLGKVVSKIVKKFVYMVETKVLGRRKPDGSDLMCCWNDTSVPGGVDFHRRCLRLVCHTLYHWVRWLRSQPELTIAMWGVYTVQDNSWVGDFRLYALPSLATLSLVSGVLSALVEAIEEFKVRFQAPHRSPRLENDRIEIVYWWMSIAQFTTQDLDQLLCE